VFKKTDEQKVMRDPIHGYIHVDDQIIWDCINAKEMQRLRRIHQLGGDFQIYHTAEHSRFAHSLGVYEIVRRMVNEIEELKLRLSDYEKLTVMLAGLLHDIGHGPFSHAFEAVSLTKHEEYTCKIITESSEVHSILARADASLSKDIADIIKGCHRNDLLNQIVSGQLDADRMDYLLRDAYFTGTSYGHFDLERIIRTIRIVDQRMTVKESGIHSVEDYIMARYHMYWQVYLHPVARSYEGLLVLLFRRMKDLYRKDPDELREVGMLIPFLKETPATIDELFLLDEAAAFYGLAVLRNHPDPILKDLTCRILDRNLFEYETISDEKRIAQLKQLAEAAGYLSDYYIYSDTAAQTLYSPYQRNESGHNIWILGEDQTVKELSTISPLVHAVCHEKLKEDRKVYYPKEILQRNEKACSK